MQPDIIHSDDFEAILCVISIRKYAMAETEQRMKAETGICGPRSLLTAHRLHENLNNISLVLRGLAGFSVRSLQNSSGCSTVYGVKTKLVALRT